MTELMLALIIVLLASCAAPGPDLGDAAEGFRGPVVNVCVSNGIDECRVDLNGAPCLPVETQACEIKSPTACVDIANQCEVVPAGDPCPQGWFDGCTYYM